MWRVPREWTPVDSHSPEWRTFQKSHIRPMTEQQQHNPLGKTGLELRSFSFLVLYSIMLTALAFVTFLVLLALAIEMALGNRTIPFLKDVPPAEDPGLPNVSILIAARNEGRNIETALQSILHMAYEPCEVIVVNDRSTDQTGKILEQMARSWPALKVVTVQTLSNGWLGKNHALYQGAQIASGEYLLFADADIVMDKTVLARAVTYVQEKQIDHLAALPELALKGLLLNLFASGFTMFFSAYFKPWKVKDPKSSRFMGVGAFNLMKTSTYRAIGTHQRIAMRPDDDLMLGKLVKRHGFRQDLVFGKELLWVEWYGSVGEMVNGLMKNSFSGFEYRLWMVVAVSLASLVVNVWPLPAIFLTHGWAQGLNAGCVGVTLLLFWDTAGFLGYKRWYGIGIPFAALFGIYVMWRAALLTLLQGGIRWRGTFYPLDQLKANKV